MVSLAVILLLALTSDASSAISRAEAAAGRGSQAWEVSKLSASGKALIRQCQRSLRRREAKPSLPRSLTWIRWGLPPLPHSPYHKTLGWVETAGLGIMRAHTYRKQCFLVAVRTREGNLFDRGCFQRAAFMGNLTSTPDGISRLHINAPAGSFRFAADVTYLPNLSMHNVCYVPPHPGQYRLDVSLMFSNALEIKSARIHDQARGFANYTPVVSTTVNVTGGRYFSLYNYRKRMPPCNMSSLVGSRNRGFWIGYTWLPYTCRLRRLAPFSLLQWLNGKNVLFLGDSEMRYLYGVTQVFLSMRSRMAYVNFLSNHPWHRGSKLETLQIPGHGKGQEPPREDDPSGHAGRQGEPSLARHFAYPLSTGYSIYFGGRYSGFGRQRVRFRAHPRSGSQGPLGTGLDVDFNLTYVTYMTAGSKLFESWMVDGSLTGGEKAFEGRPFDVVIEASQLHSVLQFESPVEYGRALSSQFVPQLRSVCPQPKCSFVELGPLVGMESWKPWRFVHMSNNVRNFAFEDEAYSVLRQHGLPHVLHIDSLTTPIRGSELAADPAHYRAPVTLAMMDLTFGALCNSTLGSLL